MAVLRRAVIARINRKLEGQQETLKATRGERARVEIGDYYVLDLARNVVLHKDIDVEEYARELGVLKPWEFLADPD